MGNYLLNDQSGVDMIQVLQELEIGDSDSSRVNKNIREDQYSVVDEHLLGFLGGGAIGCFRKDLAVEFVGIVSS